MQQVIHWRDRHGDTELRLTKKMVVMSTIALGATIIFGVGSTFGRQHAFKVDVLEISSHCNEWIVLEGLIQRSFRWTLLLHYGTGWLRAS